MVIVNFGNGVTDMRGSAAGNTWSKNASGPYMKKKSSPVNQMTAAQLARRSAMSNITQVGNDLSIGLKQAWSNYAAQNPVTNRFGNPTVLTWLQMFNKVNGILVLVGEAIRNTPPPNIETQIITPNAGTTVISEATQNISLAFAPSTSATVKILVRMTPPINVGKINVNNLYKVVGFSAVAQSSPVVMVLPANIGTVALNDNVSVRVETVDTRNGRLSAAFDFLKVVAA